jgi:hypothetical protein
LTSVAGAVRFAESFLRKSFSVSLSEIRITGRPVLDMKE